jgi:hypothetical protein
MRATCSQLVAGLKLALFVALCATTEGQKLPWIKVLLNNIRELYMQLQIHGHFTKKTFTHAFLRFMLNNVRARARARTHTHTHPKRYTHAHTPTHPQTLHPFICSC